MKIDIQTKSQELKDYISQFETNSFVSQICFVLNSALRMDGKALSLKSPAMQVLYLLSLFLNTSKKGNKKFDLASGRFKYIEQLLTDVENGYRYNFMTEIQREGLTEDVLDRIEVSQSTYIDFFVNAPLNYTEQEIDKIQDIFSLYDDFIYKQTGLYLKDYLLFFEITENIDTNKYTDYQKQVYTEESLKYYQQAVDESDLHLSNESFSKLYELAEKAISSLSIQKEELLNNGLSEDKINKLLNYFSIERNIDSSSDYLYYTQSCPLLLTPIIRLPNDSLMFPMQKQLIHAIFNHLLNVCMNMDKSGRKILERRDKRLEEKTVKVIKRFLGDNAKVYTNYYVNDSEKDILVLYRDTAFIIECKAHKSREPFRDIDIAFTRIKDDFRKSIQKGFDQVIEVYDLFEQSELMVIKNNRGNAIAEINTRKYRNVFTLIITQERLGQIQVDLGLLLDIKDACNYPWSICVDDLESILITLSRRESPYGDFITYLSNREKLYERVWCFDELELVALYLTNKKYFIDICNRTEYFLSNPHEDQIFDFLYNIGFGFKNERNLENKKIRAQIISDEVRRNLINAKLKHKPR